MTDKALVLDPALAKRGAYCKKRVANCYCAVGWSYEVQCPRCRDRWPEGAFRDSYCICPPDKPDEEER
jgi:hypothetical protein